MTSPRASLFLLISFAHLLLLTACDVDQLGWKAQLDSELTSNLGDANNDGAGGKDHLPGNQIPSGANVNEAPDQNPQSSPSSQPSPTGTPAPSANPTSNPTPAPTDEPVSSPGPSAEPTANPTPAPTDEPVSSPGPSAEPTANPTPAPTDEPVTSPRPSAEPTANPTPAPTNEPVSSPEPTLTPSPTSVPPEVSCADNSPEGFQDWATLEHFEQGKGEEFIAEATAFVARIELRKGSGRTIALTFSSPRPLDLTELQSEISHLLSDIVIPAGRYDSVRLAISQTKLILKDGRRGVLKIPSADASGLKIFFFSDLVSDGRSKQFVVGLERSPAFIAVGQPKKIEEACAYLFVPPEVHATIR